MEVVSERSVAQGSALLRAASWLSGRISLLVTVLVLMPFAPKMPRAGLDPSWQYALNVAVEKGLVFGKDVVFTFGPLGLLYTQLYTPATDALMMWGSAAYAVAFVAAFGLAAYPRRMLIAIALPLLVVVMYFRDPLFMSMPLLLLLGVTRTCVPEQSKLYLRATPIVVVALAFATVGVGMATIVKGSFIGVVIPVVGLAVVVLARRSVIGACAFMALFVGSVTGWWVASGQAVRDLPGFFIAQSPIISGYGEAMALFAPANGPILYVIASLVLGFIVWQTWRRESRAHVHALLLGLAWTLFVAFKAGFVRNGGHSPIAAGTLLLVTFAVATFAPPSKAVAASIVSAIAVVIMVRVVTPIGWTFPVDQVNAAISSFRKGMRVRLGSDRELPRNYRQAIASLRKSEPLPAVSGTVDIYPYELSAVLANGLTWSGRPVFQSYSAYTPELLKLNADHLRSPNAPKNIFFTFSPIDGRLPVAEDSASILPLLSLYRIVGYREPYIQFERAARPNDVHLRMNSAHTVIAAFGQEQAIKADEPTWVAIDMHRTLLGRVADALFKLPQIELDVTLSDGTVARHRYVPQVGRSGFIISPYLSRAMDLVDLVAGVPGPQTVKSFKLETQFPWLWKPAINVTQIPVDIAPQESVRSLAAAKPTAAPLSAADADAPVVPCSIDFVNHVLDHGNAVHATSASTLRVDGWIVPAVGMPIADFDAWIVATSASGDKRYFEASRVPRPDVAAVLKRPDVVDSGFTIILDTRSLQGPQRLELVTASKNKAFRCGSTLTLQ